MVKFASSEDNEYKKISGHLQLMAAEAGEKVRSSWEMEARVDDARNGVGSHTFNLPFSLSEVTEATRFVGRKDELLQLHRGLNTTQDRRVAILHGLGGIGKTQLTIAYLKSYRANYSAIIWLNARDETSLEQGFSIAAKKILGQYPSLVSIRTALDGQEPQGIVQAVKRWLDEPGNDRWLLVFDNYDNPKLGNEQQSEDTAENRESRTEGGSLSQAEAKALKAFDIRLFFPDSYQGSIIITTRASINGIGNSIFLRKLTDMSDGLEILSSTSHRKDVTNDDAAVELARRLDGLPLALATAGAYLNQVSSSWVEYLEMYQTSWLRLLKTSPVLLSYENRALYSTWDISYRQIERKKPAAAMLLKLWAYFDKEDLWYELLRYEYEEVPTWFADMVVDRISFNEVMRVLCDHGLVEVGSKEWGAESRGYSVHDCVHSWMISVLNAQQDAAMAQLALCCVAQRIPNDDQPDYWLTQRRLLLHADICASHMLRLVERVDEKDSWTCFKFGCLYADQGRHKAAEAMLDRALQGYEEILGPGHIVTLDIVNSLAILCAGQGRYGEAEAMYDRALQGYEKVLGPDHHSTLNVINNSGNLYARQGRYEEADAMYNRAFQGFEKTLGPEHRKTLDIVHNVGALYWMGGRYAEAELMYDRALRGKEKALGLEHISTLDTVNNLGSLYVGQGRFREAEAMCDRALLGEEKALGAEHTSTLDTVNNIGLLFAKQGRHKDAEAMYDRALQGYEKVFGPAVDTQPEALFILQNLGNLAVELGDHGRAEDFYARALFGFETVFGRENKRYQKVSSQLRQVRANISQDT
ncbi:P-loop containing nucleoside triphosphate hydrolase protein [Dactylonectria macrodidyma]|uniref:P-loop containing nucleoside triphosphate hydrolase protein n=1 Tax=Dactylonectria macrodidyma TaxID=307937 RepID=A0A9P9EBH5_9HYPO|nr:P-loop containing nucleoside triphosphate hydrolase protein [Dactylonectria macrodidyma]